MVMIGILWKDSVILIEKLKVSLVEVKINFCYYRKN